MRSESSWIKFPSLSLFITLTCFSVAQFLLVLFFSHPPPPPYLSHSIIIPRVIRVAETDTSNFFLARDSMLFLLVFEQYSPDIVGRRLSPVWNCHAEPLLFCSYQLLTMPVPSSIAFACQLWYLFSKHAFDSSVFSGKFGLGSTSLSYLLIQSAERNLGYREAGETGSTV